LEENILGRRKIMAEENNEDGSLDLDKTVEISDFFTTENETNGTWYEPVIFGVPFGLEFKVIGARSVEAEVIGELRNKEMERISLITNEKERAEKNKNLLNEMASKLVSGLRPARGLTVTLHGNPITYDKAVIKEIFEKQQIIPQLILAYSSNGANFIGKKSD